MYPKRPPFQQSKYSPVKLGNQKREHLRTILMTKFRNKYGHYNNPMQETILKDAISVYLQQEKLTEKNLRNLDRELLKKLKVKKPPHTTPQPPAPYHQTDTQAPQLPGAYTPKAYKPNSPPPFRDRSQPPASTTYQIPSPSPNAYFAKGNSFSMQNDMGLHAKSPSSNLTHSIGEDYWAKIIEYNKISDEAEKKQRFLKIREEKMRLKNELQKQMLDKRLRAEKERENTRVHENLMRDQMKREEEEDQKKRVNNHIKVMHQRQLRDDQREQMCSRKKREQLETQKKEQAFLEKTKTELEQEKVENLKKKEKAYQIMQKMIKENMAHKETQISKKKEEKEQDRKAQLAYAKYLEEQELKRMKVLKDKEERMQKILGQADSIFTNQKKKMADEDSKIMETLLKKEKEGLDQEFIKKQRQKKQELETKRYLDLQVKEKIQKDEVDKRVSDKIGKEYKRQFDEFAKEEIEKKKHSFNRNKYHSNELVRQIDEKKSLSRLGMNNKEFLMNKKLLTDAEHTIQDHSSHNKRNVMSPFSP
jgi:hypothetical protein